jgi:uncharacterized protein YndB with AHSA1/START domain
MSGKASNHAPILPAGRGLKALLGALVICLLLAGLPASAQRPRRRSKAVEKPSPVQVTRSVTLRVVIASDTVGIFEYLSDPAKLAEWFPDQAIVEPQLGGRYHFRWKDSADVWSGVITEFIRGNTLAYTWQSPGEATETNVRYKLFPQGGETLVELTHRGFSSAAAEEKAISAWTFYLENLKSVIEDGTDLRSRGRRQTSRKP